MGRFIDLTDMVFERLTVIGLAKKPDGGKYPKPKWECKCICGKKIVVLGDSLRNGNTKSCGCLQRELAGESNKIDIANRRYGRLVAVKRVDNTRQWISRWLCQCDCGNTCEVDLGRLQSENTKSCGCLKKEVSRAKNFKDLTNKRFGKLVAKECVGQVSSKKLAWFCECDCGGTCVVRSSQLIRGSTQSCGCIKSLGEKLIEKVLRDNNIKYQKQFGFDELRGINGGKLRFDFAILSNENLVCLIEFDGSYHYRKTSVSYNGIASLDYNQEHDKRKNEYCALHNIKLYRLNNHSTIEDDVYDIIKRGV